MSNLKSRTGVETMLFLTRGSTDLPLRGVAFATKGVEDFLESALKTDEQDFIGKMEGFAIQGVKGSFFDFVNRSLPSMTTRSCKKPPTACLLSSREHSKRNSEPFE